MQDSKETEKYITASRISQSKSRDNFSTYREWRLDIEAAIRALANIASKLEKQGYFQQRQNELKYYLCDLRNADLRGLRFDETDFSNFDLAGVDFSGAWLS